MSTTNGTSGNGQATESDAVVVPSRVRGRAASPLSYASRPLVRRVGRIAKEAQLRARLELARVMGDHVEERATSRKLAEQLASHDAELDAAIELALRTLAAADDPELRHALAGWLEGLGEAGLAASELRKLPRDETGDGRVEAAAVLVRIGVLHARAGDAFGAHDALEEAATLDESDALPLELIGAIGGWAPDALTPRAGAEAYVRAAKRRARAGDDEGELEDLLRAFELDPSSPLATAALVAAHTSRERGSAADEVLRVHAASLGTSDGASPGAAGAESTHDEGDAAEVHARRRAQALERGDLPRALAAALDEGLDSVFDGPGADAVDDLLVRAGAFETLAVRLEMRAERAKGRCAAQKWAELGRLLSGPLASSERAVEAYARSVAIDATGGDALHALRALAHERAPSPWVVEGMLRAAMGTAYGASAEPAARLAGARALALHAEEGNDAALAAWAHGIVAELDDGDERARNARARFADAARLRDEEIELAERSLETSAEGGRAPALEHMAGLLRSVPGRSRQLAAVLSELASARPDDDSFFADALRVAERISDFAGVVALCRARVARGGAPPRVRLALVAALRRAGDTKEAAASAADLLDACTPWAYSVAWITAAAAGDRATRARALAALAPTCGSAVVAVLASAASEELAAAGDVVAARRAAEQACRADAEDARAIRAVAAVVTESEGRIATTALERAAAVAGPTAALCLRLAQALENVGDTGPAVAWARRAVALRPGDPAIVQALIDRAARVGDAEALADAIAWLLPQPVPARVTADRLAPALRMLGERDPARAAVLARRALDILGPRHAALRAAIEEVADAAKDGALRGRVVERWIAAGAPAAERGPLLLTLAAHHASVGDVEREVGAYVRAARAGVDLAPVRERIEALHGSEQSSPDAELALVEARAELLLDEGRTDIAAAAFRDLGAALWDMADDRPRAVQAWLRAAQLDSARGYATLRRDLTTFADAGYAVDCLAELVDREGDRARAGIIATEAARAASEAGAFPRAILLARTALERNPSHAEALAIAERAAEKIGRLQEMSPIYDYAARGALGRFGRRAAHHRAARFFEAHAPMLALKHAAQAFIAVPSEGTTLGLLERTADRAQRRSVAVRTVEHVAELARNQTLRAAWLLRAATLTSRDLEGARQRVDLLLKAAVLSPAPVTLSMLAVAARELVSLAPDDGEAIAMRLERACDSLAKNLEGPDGARMAITFADMALDLFEDAGWAWRAIERALSADADVDEYVRLTRFAEQLARAEGAMESLSRVVAACDKPYSNVGVALLRLVGSVASAMGDGPRSVRAFVQAAEKDPDDDETVALADAAVTAHPDPAFVERLSKKVGVFRRSQALRAIAAKRNELGDHTSAIASLERALQIAPNDAREEIARELNATLLSAGRGEEAVLRELSAPGVPPAQRAEQWASLAKIREERGDTDGATDALLQAATDDPTAPRWAAVERAAEASGREHVRVQALQNLASHVDAAGRLAVEKRLARAEGARGSLAAAEEAWRKVLATDPGDSEADVAIEALLVARASYDELADHLGRRATRLATPGPDEGASPVSGGARAREETLRAVRLRRAAILEQRLGRLEDAAAELEQLLRETPHHASALRWLADILERANLPQRALPVLEELAASATDAVEQESIGARRVRALLSSGDLEGARAVLAPLLGRRASSAAVHEARVEIARASMDPNELGAALEDLARASPDDARARSEMLVEAAQAAARAGDTDVSLARAKDAARLAPDIASTQLFARGLEYRLRGAGSLEDAKATIKALERLAGDTSLEPEDIALRAFLLAEAEDVVTPGAGEKTLRECLAAVGPQALVALGLAERAVVAGHVEDALGFFRDAAFGNLLGLRRPGRVALAAAVAAERVSDADATLLFLTEAAKDLETRAEALRRLAQLPLASDPSRAREVLSGLAESLEGAEKAEVLAQLARALFDSVAPGERLEADRTLRAAIELAPPELAERLRAQLGGFRSRPPPTSSNPPSSYRPPSGTLAAAPRLQTPPPGWGQSSDGGPPDRSPAPRAFAVIGQIPTSAPAVVVKAAEELGDGDIIGSVRHPPLGAAPVAAPASRESGADAAAAANAANASRVEPRQAKTSPELPANRPRSVPPNPPASAPVPAPAPSSSVALPAAITAVSATTRLEPQVAKIAEARAKIASGAREEGEKLLADALRDGSLAAADELDALLSEDPSRGVALLKVRRQAVELRPGDMKRLAALRDAARADKNPNYVRAIEHVLRAFDPRETPVVPPPLSAQSTQPGMLTLLTRHSREPAGEAFGVVWEGASAIFSKSPIVYRMTGLERVAPGPMWTLSRLYEVALRLLDTPRVALFHRRGEGPLTLTVALLQSPSAILGGEAKEDGPDVRWMLGHALASVLPNNALPTGLGDAEGRVLWDVLLGAFGPPSLTKMDRTHANLADMLWQTLAPRAQRRLKELLVNEETPFELVVERANQSGRRVGMFLTGDFAHAARTVVGEHAALDAGELQSPGGLEKLCRELPSLADLFRLAVRPEYADARWHVPTPQSTRFPFAAGGLPPV